MKEIRRREFLGAAVAGSAALVVGPSGFRVSDWKTVDPDGRQPTCN